MSGPKPAAGICGTCSHYPSRARGTAGGGTGSAVDRAAAGCYRRGGPTGREFAGMVRQSWGSAERDRLSKAADSALL